MNPFQRLGALAAALAALLLAGCGPSGGGTGTGDALLPLSDFGARATSSCSAPFASALDCDVVATTITSADALAGTAEVLFGSGGGRDAVRLRLRANVAELDLSCGTARFDGTWGVGADGTQGYFGQWRTGDGMLRARLLLRAQADGSLQMTLSDHDSGQLLLGARLVPLAQDAGC